MKVDTDLSSLLDLESDLKLLTQAENDRVKSKAALKGVNVFRNEARKRAPRRKGKLKRNIVSKVDKQNPGTAGVTVNKKAFHWRFLEYGTTKMAAKPIFRPTFEAKVDEATKVAGEELAKGVDGVLKR